MKPITLLAWFWSLLWSPNILAIEIKPLNSKERISYPSIVRVYFEQQDQIQKLTDFSDVWTINPKQKFAIIQINDKATFQKIEQMNLPVYLDQKLMDQYHRDLFKISQNHNLGSGIPGFSCYSTVAETFLRMDQMEIDFPDLVEIDDIGDSWEKINISNAGSDLRVIKLTNQNIAGPKPILFTSSSVHPREYATAELNTRFAEYLLNNYGVDADVTWILDHHEIHLSLITNPDGREQAQTGILWRKNTNQAYCSPNSDDRGVDLNRNYPFEWGIGGSTNGCSETFRGPVASSEPEITAQMNYIRQIYADNRGPGANDAAPDDTAGIFVDIHSFSQLILWPWGYTNNNSANDNQLQALGKRTAFFNQYRPQPVNDLVITGGGSIDASYGELGVASLAFELGTAFFQDCASFENQILPDNLQALLYLARVTQAPYIQPLGPDVEELLVIPNVITADTTIEVSGIANDNRYNQSNGAQATETVHSVHAYINELPINSNNGQALNAFDGNFNTANEAFTGVIDTTGLPVGNNFLYIQASDNNQDGGTFAKFIHVVNANNVANISGLITDAATGLPIEKALLDINQSQALSGSDGTYTQWVQPGTANLIIKAESYATQIVSDLSLNAGGQLTQNIQLQPFCDIFNDDMETGAGNWLAESSWAISNELSNSPSNAWSDSPGGDYSNNTNSSLTSVAIDVSEVSSLEVSYMSFCDTEATYDFGHFEVQHDGGTWQEISQCDNQDSWQQEVHMLDLPSNTNTLKIRFRLTTDVAVTQDGWHIDDVSFKASGAVCGFTNPDIIFADGFE